MQGSTDVFIRPNISYDSVLQYVSSQSTGSDEGANVVGGAVVSVLVVNLVVVLGSDVVDDAVLVVVGRGVVVVVVVLVVGLLVVVVVVVVDCVVVVVVVVVVGGGFVVGAIFALVVIFGVTACVDDVNNALSLVETDSGIAADCCIGPCIALSDDVNELAPCMTK